MEESYSVNKIRVKKLSLFDFRFFNTYEAKINLLF